MTIKYYKYSNFSHYLIFVDVKTYKKVYKSFVVQILKLNKVLVSFIYFQK